MKITAKRFGCIYVIIFFLSGKYLSTKKLPTLFLQPRPTPLIIPTSPIINNYYNVQPSYYSNPSYYLGLESMKNYIYLLRQQR